jgi:hypothetical protein
LSGIITGAAQLVNFFKGGRRGVIAFYARKTVVKVAGFGYILRHVGRRLQTLISKGIWYAVP